MSYSLISKIGRHGLSCAPMIMTTLQRELLKWYQLNKRALPWRGETDPYKIWVSEVMLQQTQAVTVTPYYERFLVRFPSVEILAAATMDEVLKMWEGLGYYARARNLYRAAQQIVSQHNGYLPSTCQALKALPGFGEYTAGAVASIAFAENVAAIDGNVKRVISRLFAIEEDITHKAGREKIKAKANTLAQQAPEPGEWTQALMELGALICTPTRPQCTLCPLEDGICQARLQGLAESLPVKPRKKAIPHYNVAAGVIYKSTAREEFLIAQRPLDGLLGGLWEFPGGKQQAEESLPACLRREIKEELGIQIEVGALITSVKHAFTHFKITLHAFAAFWLGDIPQKLQVADWAWVNLNQVDNFAFGRTDRKVIAVLRKDRLAE